MLGSSKNKPDPVFRLIDFICGMLFFGLVITVLAQILFRFIPGLIVPWTEELSRILFVYIIFLGLALLEADDNMIKVTFMVDRLPYKSRFILQVFLNIFSIIFLICLFIGSIIMYGHARVVMWGTMPFLTASILYIPIMIACPLAIYYLIRQLFRFEVKKFEDPDAKPQSGDSAPEEGTA